MPDLGDALRSQGKRMTPQRRRVLDALGRLEHATPDEVAAEVGRDGGPALPASTIYRALEVLEELGFVAHTHLDHRAPSYHLAGHSDHIHLVCLGCGRVDEAPVREADAFVGNLRTAHGFDADVTHTAVHGWCADCAAAEAPDDGDTAAGHEHHHRHPPAESHP